MKKRLVFGLMAISVILLLVACGGGGSAREPVGDAGGAEDTSTVSAGDPVQGKVEYEQLCIACHGPEGVGVENLGKPFNTSEFVKNTSDEDLLAFVKTGRPISDPANTTGVDMPPKGGNPALSDEQIMNIIAYIRTLQ